MRVVKDGERYYAENNDGKRVAYIEKNYIGTHGYWRGWEHYVWSDKGNCFNTAFFLDGERVIFSSMKEFEKHYMEKGED